MQFSDFASYSFLFPAAGCVVLAALLYWEHERLSDALQETERFKQAYETTTASLHDAMAELEKRDAVIAERDTEIQNKERNASALLAQLEELKREHANVAAWTDSTVPDSVRELLKSRTPNSNQNRADNTASRTNARGSDTKVLSKN